MAQNIKYTLFKVKWGYFGLVATNQGLIRTILPAPSRKDVKNKLLTDIDKPTHDPKAFKNLQKKIKAYYQGSYTDFSTEKIALQNKTNFARAVLTACQKIPHGQYISYADLAKMAKRPKAIRAAATIMANNQTPLIIPCHRVIKSNGKPGKFSAQGGQNLKIRMLNLESTVKKQETPCGAEG